ncbi:replicative DNA helicase [Clostridium sp. PL3]|uniref:Replicative DNA helicase n=1 Tax=Clostridium thailandense TaxID=2794346 RepID=A0A949TW58_9CLOT|nr:replicative DNA helicase [Clostridium thailandense]MBV7271469.1 replicative DNA helicase [Clostridium thailandense]
MNIEKMYNLDAEKNVLASIFMYNDSLCEVMDLIKAKDFYSSKNKIIYKNLMEMHDKRIPIDIVTFCDRMGEALKEIGGVSYITEIINSSVTATNIKRYGQIVKEKSNYRELMKILESSLDKLKKAEDSTEDIIDYAQNSLMKLDASETKDTGEMLPIMDKYMDTLQARYEKGGAIQGIKTGYKILDKTLGGLQKEELVILAGRPSMGKTATVLNIILNSVFKEEAKVAFFNLEMGPVQVIDRVLAIYTGIFMDKIKNAELTDRQWCAVTKAASVFAGSNMKIYNKIFKLSLIKSECRKLKIKRGLDIVVIDHLQLIEGVKAAENRNVEIAKITRELKLMAKELEVTVILVSQLSRAPEARSDHRPILSDLRESGSIEQDADVVMLLYRDEYYDRDSEEKGIIECIVGKNRNGETGVVRFRWVPEVQRIW